MVRRRLLLVLLLGVLVAGGAAVGWQARTQARLVERDLTAARDLLSEAGGFSAGKLEDRLVLVDRAEGHALAAQRRLGRPPLRVLGALPLIGRDVRVARALTASAVGTVRSTGTVVTALQPIQAGPPTRASILRASGALLGLHGSLEADLERVRAARPLLAADARDHYLAAATSASATAERAGQALKLAAGLYGPPGSARWFLAFQNPAELRGTGGLIGEYGILESSPSGPKLVKVAPYEVLDALTRTGVGLPKGLAGRYERLGVDRAWSAVNIPPDMPTVGGIATRLYRAATGDRIDGVIAADPLAVAQVLEAGGPIRVDGIRLDADNVAQETLVQAYIRYADDNTARKRFLRQAAAGAFDAFRRTLARRPVELMQGLATAARGRHVQVYSADPAGQRALVGLGVGGSAAAPAGGDYLMAVGINAGGNKLDAFLRRTLHWRVRLAGRVGQGDRLPGPPQHRAPHRHAPLRRRAVRPPVPQGRERAAPDPVRGRPLRLQPGQPGRPPGRGRGPGRAGRPRPDPAGGRARRREGDHLLPAEPDGRGRATGRRAAALPAGAAAPGHHLAGRGQGGGGPARGVGVQRAAGRGRHLGGDRDLVRVGGPGARACLPAPAALTGNVTDSSRSNLSS